MPIPREALDFLVENRMRNSREWFQENRDRYHKLVFEPMAELATRLGPELLKIDPQLITEPKVDKTISRIYRDTRFSKDKSLYRSNCWLVFMRSKKLYHGLPAFYFDMGPDGFSYGMGYYSVSTATMAAIRTMILAKDPSFARALKAFEEQNTFVLDGEMYKKSRHPEQPPHLRQWLDRKGLSLNCNRQDDELLHSDRLADTLLEGYRMLAPVYTFLWEAEGRKPR